ncbi:polysaccharide export outer membrane protein [Rhizobium sp. RU35A]|uniref:polysaccharide biosynthesis/export family protein n=1 Tax=Rhizobium sp. RU35A TaxID=1907414 RepID=UPI00095446D2|nr:polysaccharide biosynthesis/export family protein [Rhizobium sp. RU35A]SIQ48968.1 polysaccharide export outer membrane protein [Rhizobium sp. RU35A]
MRKIGTALFCLILVACARPSDGPSASSFYDAKDPATGRDIPVVRLSQASLSSAPPGQVTYNPADPGLSIFRSSGANDTRLRQGDVIEVTIIDTGEEGLFSSANSRTLPLGRFTVDATGNVVLPFVGKQRVLNSSPEALQSRIVSGLKGSAVNPQAVVNVVDRPGYAVTVGGSVHNPGRVPLSARKERVSDAIAMAGGALSAPASTIVTLMRGSRKASAPLSRVLAEAPQNVNLLPDDQIFVQDSAPSFTVMGAFKSTGEFKFEPGQLTLAQAIGRAGGLLDDRADASQVYLLRNQVTYAPVASSNGKLLPATTTVTNKPVIYRADMKDIATLALMQQFQMANGDILYAGNSGLVDFAKLFNVYQKSPNLPAASPPVAPSR